MSDVRWLILRDRFPLAAPTEELGTLTAPDRATAEQRGRALYGPPVVARSILAVEAAKRDVKPKPDSRRAVDRSNDRRSVRRAHARAYVRRGPRAEPVEPPADAHAPRGKAPPSDDRSPGTPWTAVHPSGRVWTKLDGAASPTPESEPHE